MLMGERKEQRAKGRWRKRRRRRKDGDVNREGFKTVRRRKEGV